MWHPKYGMIDFILFDENDVGCIFIVMVIFHESYFENIHGQTGASKQQAMLKDEKWLWFSFFRHTTQPQRI